MQNEIIDRFFSTYMTWWKEEIGMDLDGNDSDVFTWEMSSKLKEAELNEVNLSQLETVLGSELPSYYKYFLTQYSYESLMLPLIDLTSTDDVYSLMEYGERCKAKKLIPVAHGNDGETLYCIDLTSDTEAIIAWSYDEKEPDRSFILVNSFCEYLEIITKILKSGIQWYEKNSTTRNNILEEIKSIDPKYFGGSAWDKYWKMQLIKSNITH